MNVSTRGLMTIALGGAAFGFIIACATLNSRNTAIAGASETAKVAQQDRQTLSKPNAWYPRTEQLAPDETIVVALETGMSTPSSASGSGSTISSGASIAPSSANEAISDK